VVTAVEGVIGGWKKPESPYSLGGSLRGKRMGGWWGVCVQCLERWGGLKKKSCK